MGAKLREGGLHILSWKKFIHTSVTWACIRFKWLLVFMLPDYLLHAVHVRFYSMSNFKLKRLLIYFWKTLNSTWMFGLVIESFFFLTFQFTRFLNDFLLSNFHENWYEVLMGQFILGNETINVAKTCQFLHDIRADSLKKTSLISCSGFLTWVSNSNLTVELKWDIKGYGHDFGF